MSVNANGIFSFAKKGGPIWRLTTVGEDLGSQKAASGAAESATFKGASCPYLLAAAIPLSPGATKKLGSSRGMDTKRPRGSERSKPCHQLRLTRRSQRP